MKVLATVLGAAMAGGLATMVSIHAGNAELQHHGGGAMLVPTALFGTNDPEPAKYSSAMWLRVISNLVGNRGSITSAFS